MRDLISSNPQILNSSVPQILKSSNPQILKSSFPLTSFPLIASDVVEIDASMLILQNHFFITNSVFSFDNNQINTRVASFFQTDLI